MQRSISYKNSLNPFLYVILFITYESMSSIYLFLPPLFAVLFMLFIEAIKKEDYQLILLVSFCLVVFESQMNYPLFSSLIYFGLVYKFIMPKIKKNFSCTSCAKALLVLVVYLGFYLFLLFLSTIFMLDIPSINYYIIYYMIIEFFIVSML